MAVSLQILESRDNKSGVWFQVWDYEEVISRKYEETNSARARREVDGVARQMQMVEKAAVKTEDVSAVGKEQFLNTLPTEN